MLPSTLHIGVDWADAEQLLTEMDTADDEDVEDDEEEIDVDVSLAATVEERRMIGIRRSARIISSSAERSSIRVAQLMQEQTEQEACHV